MASLSISTTALESGSASDDSTYTQLENQLQTITTQRDALASQMIATLEAGEFGTNGSTSFNQSQVQKLIQQGQTLISHVEALGKK